MNEVLDTIMLFGVGAIAGTVLGLALIYNKKKMDKKNTKEKEIKED